MWPTVIGVLLGFFLSKVSDYWQARQRQRAIERTVRTLISLETEKNASELLQYWEKVASRSDWWSTDDGEFSWGQLATEAVAVSLPELSSECWHANLSRVPDAYTNTEIDSLWRKYTAFNDVERMWRHLVTLTVERRETANNIGLKGAMKGSIATEFSGQLISGMNFANKAIPAAQEFAQAVEEVIGKQRVHFPGEHAQQSTPADAEAAERLPRG